MALIDANDLTAAPIVEPPLVPPWWERYTPRQVATATFVVGLVAIAFALLIELNSVILICFVAIVISTVVQPVVDWLQRRGLRYGLALPITYLLLLGVSFGLAYLLLPPLVLQVSALTTSLPTQYTALRELLLASRVQLINQFGQALPRTLTTTSQLDAGTLPTLLASWGGFFINEIFVLAITLLVSYYWVIYRRRAVQAALLMLPLERREGAGELWNAVEGKVGAFVRGQAILCLAILVLSLIGYSLIGLPYTVVISILAGILEAVPYVGPLFTGVIAVAIGLSVSPQTALIALVVSLIIQQLESTLLVPRIMGRAVGVNAVVTLLALTAFSLLFGLLGALLAIPLAAILQIFLDRLVLNAPVETAPIRGRNHMAVLLYELQELSKDVRSQVRLKEDDMDPEADQDEEELESILDGLNQLLQKETSP